MSRFILSACVAMTVLVTTQAEGQRAVDQRPGAFLLADSAMPDEPLPLVPQSTGIKEKNPWLSFLLSFVITGTGQFYNGENKKGLAMLGGTLTGLGLVVSQIDDDGNLPEDNGTVAVGALIMGGSALWSMIDAPISSNRINREARQASIRITPVVGRDLVAANLSITF